MMGFESDTAFVRELCRWADMAPSNLAKEAGLTPSTILRPFKGVAKARLSQPTLDKLKARFRDFPGWVHGTSFSVDAAELAYSFEEREWVNMLNELPTDDRKAVLRIVRSLAARADIPLLQGKRAEFTR